MTFPTISCPYGNIVNFSHMSWIHFSANNMSFYPFKPMGKPILETAPSPWGMWTPSNTWMPGPTPLTIPNDSSIGSCTSTQLRNKCPTGYNGIPQIHPKNCPSPLMITTPSNTPILRPTPLTTPKGIWIHLAILPQYTSGQTDRLTDRQTDRQTDWWSRWETCKCLC